MIYEWDENKRQANIENTASILSVCTVLNGTAP